MNNIDSVWNKIIAHQGETFYTKSHCECSYKVNGNSIKLNNTNRSIPKSNIEKAIKIPNPSLCELREMNLQGASYIFAIITDNRIKD